MSTLHDSERGSGCKQSLIELKKIMVPRVVPLGAETNTDFGGGLKWDGGGVEEESPGGVEAELVDTGIPNPFIRSGKKKWCKGVIRKWGCCDDG